jgi:hypothetical protein
MIVQCCSYEIHYHCSQFLVQSHLLMKNLHMWYDYDIATKFISEIVGQEIVFIQGLMDTQVLVHVSYILIHLKGTVTGSNWTNFQSQQVPHTYKFLVAFKISMEGQIPLKGMFKSFFFQFLNSKICIFYFRVS